MGVGEEDERLEDEDKVLVVVLLLHCNSCNCKVVLDIGNQLQVGNNIDSVDVTKNLVDSVGLMVGVEVEEKNVVLGVVALKWVSLLGFDPP